VHNKFIKSQTGAGSVLVVLGGAAPQEIKRRSIMAHAGNRKLAGSRYRRTTAAASQKRQECCGSSKLRHKTRPQKLETVWQHQIKCCWLRRSWALIIIILGH